MDGLAKRLIAILASAADHRNDVLISSAALIGVGGAYLGYGFLDPLVALIIGFWIMVHIEVDRKLTVYRAHTIGKKVQNRLEKLGEIDRAFVHIDPVS